MLENVFLDFRIFKSTHTHTHTHTVLVKHEKRRKKIRK